MLFQLNSCKDTENKGILSTLFLKTLRIEFLAGVYGQFQLFVD